MTGQVALPPVIEGKAILTKRTNDSATDSIPPCHLWLVVPAVMKRFLVTSRCIA